MINFNLHKSWLELLGQEFDKDYYKNLLSFVDQEYNTNICYPPKDEVFNAFNTCSLNNLKVVIIGQDPYHGAGQANGLCFSVNNNMKHPPSLVNIFKELESSTGLAYPKSGNLMHWANQGVLLLNATLTVRAGSAGSHQKQGWETFTNHVISTISNKKEDVIFLLWGGYAKNKAKLIDTTKHVVLQTGHPSPLSANRGYWFGNNHFKTVNNLLTSKNLKPINW